ncbi:hypothetical protein [Siphonobacter sp. SORGH_AS_1065]|uniref:hypothetical protein n=1 Tax=Siphonobacter sp. SORGH_AS_1065 TaxID=3041795 RepID=UPI002780ECB6|nr:hypothetical protein [Siphonobacter sp. SORGH_AS_1065]MDQ1089391.1 hypothetical protein [Siphonobacter sp. SORGH_AS_1065]
MKRIYSFPSLICLALLTLIYACANPFKDIDFQFKDPRTEATVLLQYANANASSAEKIPSNLKIAIVGDDAERIRNLTGGKVIRPSSEGLLGLSIDPNHLPTTQDPVKLSVLAEAEGYLSKLTRINMSDNTNIRQTVQLIDINQPPFGVSATQQTYTGRSITLQTPDLTGTGTKARWILPDNLELKTLGGNDLTGEVRAALYYINPTQANTYLPGHTQTIYNAVDESDRKLSAFLFQSLAYFQLDAFTTGGQIIQGSTGNAEVTVELIGNQRLLNGQLVKEGDVVPFWRYDLNRNIWVRQNTLRIQKDASTNKLFIKTQVSNFSYYALAETQPVCEVGPTFQFQTNLKNVDILYYAKLIDVATNQPVLETYLDLNNGSKRSFSGLVQKTVRLQVFRANNYYGGDMTTPIYTSAPVDLCDGRTIVAPISFETPPTTLSVELVVKCPAGKQVDESKLPANLYVQYQVVGTDTWRDLITLTRTVRQVASNKLEIGKRYRFRATPNPAIGWPLTQRDTLLKVTFYRLNIESDNFCK